MPAIVIGSGRDGGVFIPRTGDAIGGGVYGPNFKRFNFLAATLPIGATLTRASSGTRINSVGVLVSEANDVPRVTYNSVTLAREGLLNEPPRTNLHLNSADLTNVSWTPLRATPALIGAVAPDGTTTSGRLTEDVTAASSHYFFRVETVGASTLYSASTFARAGAGGLRHWCALDLADGTVFPQTFFDLTNGVVGHTTASSASIKAFGNGWYRPEAGLLTSAAPGTTFIDRALSSADNVASYNGDGASNTDFWGMQFEAAPDGKASSYIPTTGSSVTRAGDVVKIPLATGTYSVDITRLSGVTHLTGVAVVANSYTIPTDVSPLQLVDARRTA